jgi:hypothetical protein
MNQDQVEIHISMFNYVILYLNNRIPEEIMREVFNEDEPDEYMLNFIEKLQSNFLVNFNKLTKDQKSNLIKISYEKYDPHR